MISAPSWCSGTCRVVEQVRALAAELDATEVHIAADVRAYAQRRQQALVRRCPRTARQLCVHDAVITVVAPGAVTPTSGDHFKVFTPYFRRWESVHTRDPLPRRAASPCLRFPPERPARTARWPPAATPATARKVGPKSSTGCSPTPAGAPSRFGSWRATPPTRPRSPGLSLFDETNLAEITHPDYPDERLIACRNPALATHRAHKRAALLAATETELNKISAAATAGRLVTAAAIGTRYGKAIGRYKMGKHFTVHIAEGVFTALRNPTAIDAEAALNGIHVIRTSVPAAALPTDRAVATYKSLARVERDFRSLKAIDLSLRPITTTPRPGSGPTCSCACSPPTCSGTCATPGRR